MTRSLSGLSANPSIIYICAPNDSDGLSLALMLRRRLGNDGAPIVVRLNADSKPAALLGEEGRNAGLSNIHTFGFWDRTCTKALIQHGSREVMGQAIHEEYCLEQQVRGTLTQASKTPWDDLSEELRESNRAQADHIIAKAKAIGCRVDALTDWASNPFSLTPYEVHKLSRMEHGRWCQEKTRKGWRYGTVRDDAMKVHDDLHPWEDLSQEAKYKDIATVKKIPEDFSEGGPQAREEGYYPEHRQGSTDGQNEPGLPTKRSATSMSLRPGGRCWNRRGRDILTRRKL